MVLFDGICHLCDGAVRFILKWEKNKDLKFAPLQSKHGKALLQKHGYPEDCLDGLVLVENMRAHDRSSACLYIAGKLKFPWNLFLLLIIIPKPVRDMPYRLVGRLRYRFFGRKEKCSLPQGRSADRFL